MARRDNRPDTRTAWHSFRGTLAAMLILLAPPIMQAVARADAPGTRPPVSPAPILEPEVEDDPPGVPARPLRGAAKAAEIRFERFTHIQVNVDRNGANIPGDAANEPSIAVDPTDHQRMAIGWRQFDTVASNFRQAGHAYSTDGGGSAN